MASHKPYARGQTQVLYRYLPQAVFEHDDYGLCKVESVALAEVEINREALFDALVDALSRWTNPRFCDKYPDPRNAATRASYVVGSPREVRFAPYPLIFSCRKCGRVASYNVLSKRGIAQCQCGGALTRMRYVQAHNCGRIEELRLPDRACPKGHGREHIAFYDPGRVRQARWYCRECKSDIQGLRMTPCKCAYNDSLGVGSPPHEKWLKVVPTGDPSLYVSHTLAFVNFPEDEEGTVKGAKDSLGLMLARSWGLLDQPVYKVIAERARSNSPDADASEAALAEALRKVQPNHELVKKYDEKRTKPMGQEAVDRVAELLGGVSALSAPPRRWLIEHTTLLDKTDFNNTSDVAAMLRRREDNSGAVRIEEASRRAKDLMGIETVRIVNDFPLALCAFGYTRMARDPSRAIITPFPADERGKIPILALASETEALWFQLDPVKVVSWLIENGLASGVAPSNPVEAWAWLYLQLPGLRVSPHEPQYGERASATVRTLLHSMSHVFLRRIEWSGFSPSSVGEYLIPGSLSFILYANRYAETKIGGLTTLFEQRLDTWLWDAVQAGQECIYDPLCSDDGGSCAGCTHREHNCPSFNRELSRSTLYGGPTPQGGELGGMSVKHGYWAQAWQVTPTE